MNFASRAILTFIGTVAVSLTLCSLFGMPFGLALLVATPGCLMVGSMFVLLHLAMNSEKIDAKRQLTTLMLVEFGLVPLGAAIALVAFFVLQPKNPPDADPNWNQPFPTPPAAAQRIESSTPL